MRVFCLLILWFGLAIASPAQIIQADTTYGNFGRAGVGGSSIAFSAIDFFLDGSGRGVSVWEHQGGPRRLVISRILASGTYDPGFADRGGYRFADSDRYFGGAVALADRDDGIVIAFNSGARDSTGARYQQPYLFRLDNSGHMIPGPVDGLFPVDTSRVSSVSAIASRDTGYWIAEASQDQDVCWLHAVTPTGEIDRALDSGGSTPLKGVGRCSDPALTVRGSDLYILARLHTEALPTDDDRIAIWKVSTSGTIDPSFGTNGSVSFGWPSGSLQGARLGLWDDKLVLTFHLSNPEPEGVHALVLNAIGKIDQTFNSGTGQFNYPHSAGIPYANTLADGSLLLTLSRGGVDVGGPYFANGFFIAAFDPTGRQVDLGGPDYLSFTHVSSNSTRNYTYGTVATAVDSENRIYIAGRQRVASALTSFAVHRKVLLVGVGSEGTPTTATAITSSPNPAASSTTLRLTLASPTEALLTVTDALGRIVHTRRPETLRAGENAFNLDTSSFAPGVYVVGVRAGEERATLLLTVTR